MERVNQLMASLPLGKDAGIIISKPSNIYYLSGYTGEGLLVLTEKASAIVTDFRYVEQAQQQAPKFLVLSINNENNHAQLTAAFLREHGIKHALYEDDEYTVKAAKALTETLSGITLSPLNQAPEALRQIKDDKEIALIEKACSISVAAYEWLLGEIKPGMTESQVRLKLEFRMLELGADALAFDSIVASGENGSLPHAVPGSRQLKKGDLVTLDFGAKYQGYCSDMTRTIAIGQPSEQMRRVFDLVLATQIACQEALAPGKVCRDVDAIARKMIGDAGHAEHFGHGLGHAVGIDIHEDPRLSPKCKDSIKPGHVLTVEPGVYLPGIGGVRIENTCLVTESGARSLVSASRELVIL